MLTYILALNNAIFAPYCIVVKFVWLSELSSPSLLLPTLYLGTVAVLIPGSIGVFTMLPGWNGVSRYKLSTRKG
jgi:hypothetical protein